MEAGAGAAALGNIDDDMNLKLIMRELMRKDHFIQMLYFYNLQSINPLPIVISVTFFLLVFAIKTCFHGKLIGENEACAAFLCSWV